MKKKKKEKTKKKKKVVSVPWWTLAQAPCMQSAVHAELVAAVRVFACVYAERGLVLSAFFMFFFVFLFFVFFLCSCTAAHTHTHTHTHRPRCPSRLRGSLRRSPRTRGGLFYRRR